MFIELQQFYIILNDSFGSFKLYPLTFIPSQMAYHQDVKIYLIRTKNSTRRLSRSLMIMNFHLKF